jgi:hypothetical protein
MSKWLGIIVVTVLAISFLLASFLILYNQKTTFGKWFQIDQALHHEFFAMFFFALAVGAILGTIAYAMLDRV